MFEPNKNETKSVVSTKPVEINTDLKQQNTNQVQLRKEELSVPTTSSQANETSSYSAYASAESSPNQNSILASAQSANQLRTKTDNKSSTSSSSSLNSYLTIDNSKLMDDLAMISNSGRETPTNKEATPQSEPFYEITSEQVNRNFLEDEFQSLPPSFIDESKQLKTSITVDQINFNVIDNDLVNVNLKQTKSITQSTISDIINKEVKSQLLTRPNLDNSLSEKSNPPTPTQTNSPSATSSVSKPSTIKTTAMAIFNLFKNSDKQSEQTKPSELNKQVKTSETSLSAAKLVTTAITSASSPNPDCSPYKFLINEMSSTKTNVVVNDLNSRANKTNESLSKENQSSDKPNIIESLASLNHKESDKIDPILTGATKSENKNSNEDKKVEKSELSKSEETKVDSVPASSQEFCMNLNFNLAAAAAATAAGPVVVESMKASPEHIRYTSNASTSSIHNDLKLILEESKDTNKSSQPQQLAPKPQRLPRNKSNEKKSTDQAESSDLIKMMMNMVEANKKNNNPKQDQPVISWPKKENGRYRYTKEFLNQINEQRSEFIEQIYPDVFKAYCYCMNGKYWDPEKYFDIIQFPGEFEKIPNRNNRPNTTGYQQKNNHQQQQYQRRRNTSNNYNNKSKNDLLTPSTSVLSTSESPQPLQVPKNSPKVLLNGQDNSRLNMSTNSQKNNNKENKKKLNNILSTLGVDNTVKSNEADKILLNLIKSKDVQHAKPMNKCNDLLEILNTKKEEFEQSRQKSGNILENLFPNKTSPQQQVVPQMSQQAPKHFPCILTAQELEMSQLLTQQKQSRPRLPNTSDFIKYDEFNNASDAYKQLVKNLSNHPLNSSSGFGIKSNQQEQILKSQWSNDGTNVLRQLLNLNPDNTHNKLEKLEKKSKKKHNHHHHHQHHHHHKSTKSPSTTVLESLKFPVQNPHEKPFENFFGEDCKHVENVVASTLNHVLNKSPSTQNKNTLENLFEKIQIQQQQ